MYCGVTRNYVFVQRGFKAVKLWQITLGVCLRIDIYVSFRLVMSKREVTV